MPRRTVTKCSRRHAGDRPTTTDELTAVWGHCFGISDWERPLQSQADFTRLWSRWGGEFARRWREASPGSRPVGCYLAGEIEPPAWRHENPLLRHPVRIGGEVVLHDRGWHGTEIELEHLVELGLVDAAEYEAAVERLGRPGATSGRYETMADEA
jgi:hypothetical protein